MDKYRMSTLYGVEILPPMAMAKIETVSTHPPTLRQRLENWGNWSNSIKKERLARGIEVDLIDARKVFDAIAKLAPPQIEMLTSTFVAMLTPDEICRRLQIPPRPASNFVDAFRKAETALETQLKEQGK